MLLVGKNNEYEINTNVVIGSGSYGKVFECYCKIPNQKMPSLCAKITNIYKDNRKGDCQAQQQQEKEIDREKSITEIVQQNQGNPNLVQVYYVEHNKETSRLILIMERCISNLQEEWVQKNIYQDFEVYEFLRQFLNGYRALYEQNVVHRDIKPENILIQQIGNEKFYRLADFGIGRIYKLNDFKFTKIGTPIFASPELNSIIQDEELDRKFAVMKQEKQKSVVDIYSLGILLHLITTGGYPCDTKQVSIRKFLNELKTTPYKINLQSNQKLLSLIENMIVYDPQKRMTFDKLFDEVNRITQFRNISIQKQPPVFFKSTQPNTQQQQNGQPNPQSIFQPNAQPIFQPNPQPIFQQNPQPIFQQNPQPIFQQNNPQPIFQQNNPQPIPQPNCFNNQGNFIPQNNGLFTTQPPQININQEISQYLRKMIQIHKNTLNPLNIKIIGDFILNNAPLSNIGKLYNNFDKNISYSQEELQFYYCLKYGLQNQSSVAKKSFEEQLKDLSN